MNFCLYNARVDIAARLKQQHVQATIRAEKEGTESYVARVFKVIRKVSSATVVLRRVSSAIIMSLSFISLLLVSLTP